jgi:hypothetical protein
MLATWEAETGKIAVWGQPRKKVRPYLNKQSRGSGHVCNPSFAEA